MYITLNSQLRTHGIHKSPKSRHIVRIPRAYTNETKETNNKDLLKSNLRELIQNTGRGFTTTSIKRSEIAEAQINLEKEIANNINFEKIEGKWELIYTTARDVLPLLLFGQNGNERFPRIPFLLKTGRIYQEFSTLEEGKLKNIIKLGFSNITDDEGLSLTVNIKYELITRQCLKLKFESADIDQLRISEQVEALIAPAFLPRTGFQHQVLLALNEFNLNIPIPSNIRTSVPEIDTEGLYLITYLDDDMLIGRPLNNGGGTYIFNKSMEIPNKLNGTINQIHATLIEGILAYLKGRFRL